MCIMFDSVLWTWKRLRTSYFFSFCFFLCRVPSSKIVCVLQKKEEKRKNSEKLMECVYMFPFFSLYFFQFISCITCRTAINVYCQIEFLVSFRYFGCCCSQSAIAFSKHKKKQKPCVFVGRTLWIYTKPFVDDIINNFLSLFVSIDDWSKNEKLFFVVVVYFVWIRSFCCCCSSACQESKKNNKKRNTKQWNNKHNMK